MQNNLLRIDMECHQSNPCQHRVTFLQDGKSTTKMYFGTEIAEMIEQYHHPIGYETFEHFREYFSDNYLNSKSSQVSGMSIV